MTLQKIKFYFHENCSKGKKRTKPIVSKKTLVCQRCGEKPHADDIVVKIEYINFPQKNSKIRKYNASSSNMAFEMMVFGGKRPEDRSYGYPRT